MVTSQPQIARLARSAHLSLHRLPPPPPHPARRLQPPARLRVQLSSARIATSGRRLSDPAAGAVSQIRLQSPRDAATSPEQQLAAVHPKGFPRMDLPLWQQDAGSSGGAADRAAGAHHGAHARRDRVEKSNAPLLPSSSLFRLLARLSGGSKTAGVGEGAPPVSIRHL